MCASSPAVEHHHGHVPADGRAEGSRRHHVCGARWAGLPAGVRGPQTPEEAQPGRVQLLRRVSCPADRRTYDTHALIVCLYPHVLMQMLIILLSLSMCVKCLCEMIVESLSNLD